MANGIDLKPPSLQTLTPGLRNRLTVIDGATKPASNLNLTRPPAGREALGVLPPGAANIGNLAKAQRMENRFFEPEGRGPVLLPTDLDTPEESLLRQAGQPVEGDNLTPEGVPNPEQLGRVGKSLSSFSKALSEPGFQKFLAQLGMAISPSNTSLGEFAVEGAEAEAQRRFRSGLAEGGDEAAPVSGLSAEGRQAVIGDVRGAEQAERQLSVQEGRLDLQEESLELQRDQFESDQEFQAARTEQIKAQTDLLVQKFVTEQGFDSAGFFSDAARRAGIEIPSLEAFGDIPPEVASNIFTSFLAVEEAKKDRLSRRVGGRTPTLAEKDKLALRESSFRVEQITQRRIELLTQISTTEAILKLPTKEAVELERNPNYIGDDPKALPAAKKELAEIERELVLMGRF